MDTCRREGCSEPVQEYTGRGRRPVYCIDHMRGRGRDLPPERECDYCGDLIPEEARADAKFCSTECKDSSRIERRTAGRQGMSLFKRMEGFEIGLATMERMFGGDPSKAAEIEGRRAVIVEMLSQVSSSVLKEQADIADRQAENMAKYNATDQEALWRTKAERYRAELATR